MSEGTPITINTSKTVTNAGLIHDDHEILSMNICSAGTSSTLKNSGTISADQGMTITTINTVVAAGSAVANSGNIVAEATGAAARGGTINISGAGSMTNSGTLDADGGTVVVTLDGKLTNTGWMDSFSPGGGLTPPPGAMLRVDTGTSEAFVNATGATMETGLQANMTIFDGGTFTNAERVTNSGVLDLGAATKQTGSGTIANYDGTLQVGNSLLGGTVDLSGGVLAFTDTPMTFIGGKSSNNFTASVDFTGKPSTGVSLQFDTAILISSRYRATRCRCFATLSSQVTTQLPCKSPRST